jgi:hypothetical protein
MTMAKTWSEKERARGRAQAISRTMARRRPPRRNLVAGGTQPKQRKWIIPGLLYLE